MRVVGVQGNKIAIVKELKPDLATGSFEIIMQRVNFGGENVINLDVEVVFAPQAGAMTDYEARKKAAAAKYEAEKERLMRQAFMQAARDRIKDASSIRARPSWDLREEERTVVYRKLLERLMLDSWKLPDTDDSRRLSHVRSEVVRTIFDVDAMLYFVAPEWWMPRRHGGRLNLDVKVAEPDALADRRRHGHVGRREARQQLQDHGGLEPGPDGQLARLAAAARR